MQATAAQENTMRGETILCIAPRDWRSLWRESQPIMSRVAAQNRVLYFEPGRDSEHSAVSEVIRNAPNFLVLRTHEVQENLIVIPTPPSLPHARRHLPRSVLRMTMPLVIRLNAHILRRHVLWTIRTLGAKQAPLLWLFSPYDTQLIGQFGEKLVCYHNYDEFADMVRNARIEKLLRRLDNRLSSRADVVFATSRAQWRRRKALNPNTYFIPNGVDFELFNLALTPGLPLPDDIAAAPRPIIGFAGWLGYHIDVELLRSIARVLSDCSLVLIGPNELPDTPLQRELRTLPNVFFLGCKERARLPNYLQAFDAALMPYSLDGHVRSAYPLKLHEYLAAGRAIVATALPELRPYDNVIRIAETDGEFIEHVREALFDNSPETVEARVAVARDNTWDQRVEEMYRILEHKLSGIET